MHQVENGYLAVARAICQRLGQACEQIIAPTYSAQPNQMV
jgi:hypothetical protein